MIGFLTLSLWHCHRGFASIGGMGRILGSVSAASAVLGVIAMVSRAEAPRCPVTELDAEASPLSRQFDRDAERQRVLVFVPPG
jgi:hypothetical protein